MTGVWDYNNKDVQHTTILMLVAFGAMVSSLSFPKWWVVSSLLVAIGVPITHITLQNLGLPAGHVARQAHRPEQGQGRPLFEAGEEQVEGEG